MSHLPEDISTTSWYLKPVLCLWLTQSMFQSTWTVNPSPALHQQNNNYQHWNMHINNIYSKHWPIQPLSSSREPLSDLSGQVRNDTVKKNECVQLKQLTVISYIPELQCSYSCLTIIQRGTQPGEDPTCLWASLDHNAEQQQRFCKGCDSGKKNDISKSRSRDAQRI